jgi:predicted PurR-regulated permease PerM
VTQAADVRPGEGEAQEPAEVEFRLPGWRWIWRLFAIFWLSAGLAWLTWSLLRGLRGLLLLLVASLFVSFALEPAVSYLAKRGWRRGLATLACLGAIALVGIALLVLMVPVLVEQFLALVDAAPEIVERAIGWLNSWFGLDLSAADLVAQLREASTNLANVAGNIAGNVFLITAAVVGTVFKLLTIALFTFYLVADGPRFRRAVCSLLPPAQQRIVLDTWEVAIDKTGAYLYSRVVLAVVSGAGAYVVMRLLGVGFALPLAVWTGLVSQFIPTIGTYIAMALPLLVATVSSPLDGAILLGYFTGYQQLENYVLSPKVTAQTMQVHPALAFGSVIAGASIGGAIGALLALPAAAIAQAVGSSYVRRHEVIVDELTAEERPPPPRRSRWRAFGRRG